MSTSSASRSLAANVEALIAGVGEAEPSALGRLRSAVGARRARIQLGAEAVEIRFAGSELVVRPADARLVHGEGVTDMATTLDLLDGYLEVTDAILDGRLEAKGDVEAVGRMFLAIEILIDVASRAPGLQDLAADFRSSHLGEKHVRASPTASVDRAERLLLGRLDLLP